MKHSVVEPYADYIQQRMREGCVNAVVLLDELRQQGYTGGITTLRNFMRPYRESLPTKYTVRFETAPGHQAQVDWGSFRVRWNCKEKQLYAFVMVLGYYGIIVMAFVFLGRTLLEYKYERFPAL